MFDSLISRQGGDFDARTVISRVAGPFQPGACRRELVEEAIVFQIKAAISQAAGIIQPVPFPPGIVNGEAGLPQRLPMPRIVAGPAIVQQYTPLPVSLFRLEIFQEGIEMRQAAVGVRPVETSYQPPVPLFRRIPPGCKQ